LSKVDTEQLDQSVEGIISNIDPDYFACPFGIMIHPEDCIACTKTNDEHIKWIYREYKCVDCEDTRVCVEMLKTYDV